MKILCYFGRDSQRREQIEHLLQQQATPYTIISPQQGNATVNDILMQQPIKEAACLLPDITLLIYHEADDEQISELIQAFKAANIAVPYQCVVTKHNRTWRLLDLCQEIMEEHAYFTAYEACRKSIEEVSSLKEDEYRADTWKEYEAAFMKGYLLLQSKQANKDLLTQAVKEIRDAKAKLIKC